MMAYVIWLGVISCGGHDRSTRPAVVAPCSPVRVGQVLVTGAPRFAVPAIAVLEGTIDDVARGDRVTQVAIEGLHTLGYAKAAITVSRVQGCFVELHVDVALGPKFQIRSIEFRSTPSDDFPARERLALIEDALGSVNTIGGVYIEYRLQRALAQLQERYRDAGWLDAKISPPVARYSDAGIAIEVPIDPGPRFRVAAIRARGSSAKARAAVLTEIDIEPGGWYDGAAIRTGIERARRKLDRWVELRTTVSADRHAIELEAVVESSDPR